MVKCKNGILNLTFAALADPTRRGILQDLTHGNRSVTDLARPYAMSLPAVSKHLRILEEAGLITRTREGRVRTLTLNAAPMQQAQAWIESYRRYWEASLDRLEDYLTQLQSPAPASHSSKAAKKGKPTPSLKPRRTSRP